MNKLLSSFAAYSIYESMYIWKKKNSPTCLLSCMMYDGFHWKSFTHHTNIFLKWQHLVFSLVFGVQRTYDFIQCEHIFIFLFHWIWTWPQLERLGLYSVRFISIVSTSIHSDGWNRKEIVEQNFLFSLNWNIVYLAVEGGNGGSTIIFCSLTSWINMCHDQIWCNFFRFVWFSQLFSSFVDVIVGNLMSTMSLSRIYCISDWSDFFFSSNDIILPMHCIPNSKIEMTKRQRKKHTDGERERDSWRDREILSLWDR